MDKKYITKSKKWIHDFHFNIPNIKLPKIEDSIQLSDYLNKINNVKNFPYIINFYKWNNSKKNINIKFNHTSCNNGKCIITGCKNNDFHS